MTEHGLFPWQAAAWQQIWRERHRLPHALLLTGDAGLGKRRFAEYLAQYLLCEDPVKHDAPCGVCDGCRWFLAGNHPDYRLLAPAEAEEGEEEAKKRKLPVIGVEDVRALADFVNLTSHRSGAKVTVVYPAEAMNVAAANAFLKTLEEPPAGATFILVSNHWRRLLPTIRSRCRMFPLALPDHKVAAHWLAQHGVVDPDKHLAHTGGSPLAALDDARADWLPQRAAFLEHIANPRSLDVLAVAAQLEKQKLDVALVVSWLQKWVHDVVSLGLSGRIRYYPDWHEDLTRLSVRAAELSRYGDQLNDARKLAHHPLNTRLVFESLLFGYLDALRNKARASG